MTPEDVLARVDKDVNKKFSNADFETDSNWSAEMSPTNYTKVAGYDLAEMVVTKLNSQEQPSSKVIAIFYSKNGQWYLITQANDEYGFPCEDILNDADARKAFFDQICYQYNGEKGQVRLDTNNRALQ